MTDYVVTVPKGFWPEWIAEGDAVGEPETGEEWGFFVGWSPPAEPLAPDSRLYVVAWNKLRGYAPITRIAKTERGFAFCRRGGAVACTTCVAIPGFRGYRKRWWPREIEQAFPDWRTYAVGAK